MVMTMMMWGGCRKTCTQKMLLLSRMWQKWRMRRSCHFRQRTRVGKSWKTLGGCGEKSYGVLLHYNVCEREKRRLRFIKIWYMKICCSNCVETLEQIFQPLPEHPKQINPE